MRRQKFAWRILLCAAAMLLAVIPILSGAMALAEEDTRWADAADEIDKFLDAGFDPCSRERNGDSTDHGTPA